MKPKSSLEHLVILRSTKPAKLVEEMLVSFDSLRTFIWDDNTPCLSNCEEISSVDEYVLGDPSVEMEVIPAIDEAKDETLKQPTRCRDGWFVTDQTFLNYFEMADYYTLDIATFCEQRSVKEIRHEWTPVVNYDSDNAEEHGDIQTFIPPNHDKSLLFKPQQLLDRLSQALHDKLEHL